MDAIFYIDESGNTGTDWLNNEQPYFVYGGWLLMNKNKIQAEKYLNNILSKQQGLELKSKNILKKKDGIKLFLEIFNTMINEYNAIPFFGITEKKFMVAAKIVETFFDCEYNPTINTYLTNPVELKRALASCIYTDNNIIELFAPLIKDCSLSLEKMKEINSELIALFNKQGHKIVSESLMKLQEVNFSEMVDEFKSITHNGTKKNRITLTGTMLIELFKNIQFYAYSNHCSVKVYHDKLRGYDELFNELGRIFFKSGTPTLLGTQERPWLSNFPNIKSLDMFDSKKEINIQASDLLCGFISNIFKSIKMDVNLDNETMEILHTLIYIHDALIKDNVVVWNWYASYQFEEKFFLALNPKANVVHNRYHAVIDNDFSKAVK
jgi:hypothetical protein